LIKNSLKVVDARGSESFLESYCGTTVAAKIILQTNKLGIKVVCTIVCRGTGSEKF
jgi:hypothetical protein